MWGVDGSFFQVQEEIDRVFGTKKMPDMQGYQELKYLMRCVNESMRLYPHPPVLLRRAEIADELPGDYFAPLLRFFSHCICIEEKKSKIHSQNGRKGPKSINSISYGLTLSKDWTQGVSKH